MKHLLNRFFAATMLLTALGLVSCGNNESRTDGEDTTLATQDTANPTYAEAIISGTYADTTVTGVVKFTEDGNEVKMELDFTAPSHAGKTIAVHIHEHGDCGEHGGNAHGHWNPTNKEHGKWGNDPFHLGDIGNIDIGSDGKGHFEMETDLWSIGGQLNDILGKSIIVHSGKDDYTSQPAGAAGNRIGCGIIQAKPM